MRELKRGVSKTAKVAKELDLLKHEQAVVRFVAHLMRLPLKNRLKFCMGILFPKKEAKRGK